MIGNFTTQPEYQLNIAIATYGGLLCTFFSFEFSDHRRKARFFSGSSIFVNDPLGTCLIQCFDRFAEQSVGILNVTYSHSTHDILATIPHKRASGTVLFTSGNILTKPLFGTSNVRHTVLYKYFQYTIRKRILPYFQRKTREPYATRDGGSVR